MSKREGPIDILPTTSLMVALTTVTVEFCIFGSALIRNKDLVGEIIVCEAPRASANRNVANYRIILSVYN